MVLVCYAILLLRIKEVCAEPSLPEGASICSVTFHPITLQRRGRANYDWKDDPVYPGEGVILHSWSYVWDSVCVTARCLRDCGRKASDSLSLMFNSAGGKASVQNAALALCSAEPAEEGTEITPPLLPMALCLLFIC